MKFFDFTYQEMKKGLKGMTFNRMIFNKDCRQQRQKFIAKYKELRLSLATPADFPDSGHFWGQKEREMETIFDAVISKLPRRKYIQIIVECQKAEKAAQDAYYTPTVMGSDGNMYSAADMDRMMCYM